MKRILTGHTMLLWLLLLVVPLMEAKCAEIDVTSRWSPSAIKIDGLRADWPTGAVGFLKEPEASVGVCNDSQNLYVVLAFRKDEWARMTRMSGLTLWLDNQGKKKKAFMLKFTAGPGPEDMKGKGGPDQQRSMPPMEGADGRGPNLQPALICFEKDRIAEKQIPMDGGEGPSAAYALDQGMYVYEFKIPLHESAVRSYGVAPISGKPLSIGLVWGEMDKNRMGRGGGMDLGVNGPDGFSGGGPGGMGGGPGGGPGGPGGPMGGKRGAEKQELWLRATLVTSSSETNTKK